MAYVSALTRRTYRNRSLDQLLQLLHHPLPNSSPCSSSSLRYFSQAFHQTPLLHSPYARHFSAPSSSCQNFSNALPFDISRFQIHAQADARDTRFVELIRRVADLPLESEALAALDESGVRADRDSVCSAIWALRDEWRLSLLAFKWGEKWGSVDEQTSYLMIWVLGNHKKFSTAWCLIRELHGSLMDTRQAMLIMIDRYAHANEASKAIKTFHLMEKFRLSPDQQAFHALLSSLCKNGNTEEAEEFMLVNKKLFPLETESFNIILNGWCNLSVDVYEAKRVWKEMSKCCIIPDATSYTHMISCFSKTGNLFDSLRLYDEMKRRNWVPGLEVYNSLVYVLTRSNCFGKALKLLEKIKEMGFRPGSTTYDSLIRPLCEAGKLDEARDVLNMMTEDNVSPTIETYHSFLEGAGFERSLEILKQMRQAGEGPTEVSFGVILNKMLEAEQAECALKIWAEMKQYEVLPDSQHYSVLIQGLAKCGFLKEAEEFYNEMTSIGLVPHPKIKALVKQPEMVCADEAEQQATHNEKGTVSDHRKWSMVKRKLYRKQSRKNKSFE